jgi:adenine-specific DNA-methyltransferase
LRIFEKQNEVDFFINKDAETFLKEQFDLWLKNYLFDDESDFNERRLKQLKSLKAIAYRVIDFVSQFEDELVKVWNKPKFVLNSNYIISLDRIGRKNIGLIDAIINHKQFFKQEREWKELGLLEQFDRRKLYTNTLDGKKLSEEYQHLPIDTKNFDEDVKLEVLSLFENLDEELEGWLIHSDNYQALKTILPKFQNRIQTIYIDPPYNTDASSIIYQNNYKDSSWLSLMENRLQLAHSLLKDDGMICVAIDDEEFPQLKLLLQDIFEKTCGVAVVRSNPAGRKTKGKFAPAHEYALFYGKSEKSVPASLEKTEKSLARYPRKDERGRFEWANFIRSGSEDRREDRRTLYYPIFVSKDNKIRIPKFHWDDSKQEYILEEEPHHDETPVYPVVKKNGKTIEKRWQRGYDRVINEPEEFRVKRKATGEIAIEFKTRIDMDSLPITWWDDNRYASANYGAAESKELFGEKRFDFAKSTKLVQDCLRASNLGAKSRDFVLDFFSGSGSTAQAIMMLNAEDGGNRKFLLVEMAEYFYTVLVPRLKKLCYALSWNNGRPCKLDGLGIFCKYYDLEQYEMALRRSIYKESHPFSVLSDKTIYQQYIFLKDLKMLNSMVVDKKNNKIRIDFTKIYPNIDLAETLSNLLGKPIKKIEKNAVELEGSKRIEFEDIDFSMVKPLIWW